MKNLILIENAMKFQTRNQAKKVLRRARTYRKFNNAELVYKETK